MIGGLAPAAAYPSNEPVEANSVLFSLEVHSGRGSNATSHAAVLRGDLLHLDLPLLVGMGDATEDGTGAQDTTFLALLADLPATEIRTLVGNHDLESDRTGAASQAAWGFNGLNWTFDMGDFLVIGVSPEAHHGPGGDGSDATIDLTQDTLDFLDAELEAATKDCWIAGHAPLNVTLGGTSEWCIQPNADVLELLDAHDNAICWFSGHTHSPIVDSNLTTEFDVGSRNVCDVNCSAIAYVNPGDDAGDPVLSMLATHRDGGVDLRIRDHNRRYYKQWPEGGFVRTLEAS